MDNKKDCDWLSPVESERKWQEDHIKKIWPGYPNICPNWQILNGLIRMACDSVQIHVTEPETNSKRPELLNNDPLDSPIGIINYDEPDKPNGYIYSLLYNGSSEPDNTFTYDINEAAKEIHNYFLSFDFEIKDNKPYDSGNDLNDGSLSNGFTCFENVELLEVDGKLKVIGFMHCEGEGPVAYMKRNK